MTDSDVKWLIKVKGTSIRKYSDCTGVKSKAAPIFLKNGGKLYICLRVFRKRIGYTIRNIKLARYDVRKVKLPQDEGDLDILI